MNTFNDKITSELIEKLNKEEIPNVDIDFEGVLGIEPRVVLKGITDEKLEEMFKDIHQTINKNASVPAHFLDPMGIIEPIKGKTMSEEEYKKFKTLAEQLKKLGGADIDVPNNKRESRPLQGIGTSDILPRFPLVGVDISESKNARPNVNKPDMRGNVVQNLQEILSSKARQSGNLTEKEEGIITMEYRRRRDAFMKSIMESDDSEKPDSTQEFDQMLQYFINNRKEYKEKVKSGMDVDGDTDTLKTLANIAYGEDKPDYDKMQFETMLNSYSTCGAMGQYEKIQTHSRYGYTDLLADNTRESMQKIEVADNLIFKDINGKNHFIKYRGNLRYGVNTDGFETITVEQAKAMVISKFDGKSFIIQASEPQPFTPHSKILKLPALKRICDVTNKTHYRGNYYSMQESDDICKTLDPIFDKKIIDEFPEALSDYDLFSDVKLVPFSLTTSMRWQYVYRAGFAIVTNKFADALAKYLKGKKCLEIMAGKAVISKSLQDRGIDIRATDNLSWHDSRIYNDSWTDVEDIEAGDAIRKYNDVDVIIVSWMPLDVKGKRIARTIRKYNPDVEIISIQEDCTANESWYDRVDYNDYNEFEEVYDSFLSWWGVHDKPYSCRISKPWTERENN